MDERVLIYSALEMKQPNTEEIRMRRNRIQQVFACVMFILFAANLIVSATSADSPNQISLSQPMTVKWHYTSDQTTDLTPATDGTRVYLPLIGGKIVSLSAHDGQLRWTSDAGGELS